jgi:hypothetical protein
MIRNRKISDSPLACSTSLSSSMRKTCSSGGGGCAGIIAHIASLNDEAIYKWAINSDSNEAQALLTQALHRVNALSKTLMSLERHKRSIFLQTTSIATKSGNSTIKSIKAKNNSVVVDRANAPFVVPLPVDIDTNSVSSCFSKAFLLKASVASISSGGTMESIFITTAVVFYNVALFFHHVAESSQSAPHHSLPQLHHQQSSATAALLSSSSCCSMGSFVEKYYRAADKVLNEYMKSTRRPLWTFQAAIWYNMADCTRWQQAATPASCQYFGQLETILNLLTDPEDLEFFQRAIAMAKMQMANCYCAVVA